MIHNQYIEKKTQDNAKRNCPLCEMLLNWEDFKEQNEEKYLDLWDNEKIAILCCKCLVILKNLMYSNILEIDYPTDRVRAWRILNNLNKLGYITEEMRDTEFNDYLEYIENLRQKSILRYFLV